MKSDRLERLGSLLQVSRIKSGKSQEFIASRLGISRKTVQHWENGETAPSLFETMDWFFHLGVNPLPYLLSYANPDFFEDTVVKDDKIEEVLLNCIRDLSDSEKRQLLFIIVGEHGSSLHNILNLTTAHLHTSMRSRVTAARTILENFQFDESQGHLTCMERVMPNIDELEQAVELGKDAALSGKKGYSIWQNSKREQMDYTKES